MFSGSIYKELTSSPNYELGEVITISRSKNWKYGPGFYAAVIVANKTTEGTYLVVCKVHIADANYFEIIELGEVDTFKEAFLKWNKITWTESELIIGNNNENLVRIERKQIEKHR